MGGLGPGDARGTGDGAGKGVEGSRSDIPCAALWFLPMSSRDLMPE